MKKIISLMVALMPIIAFAQVRVVTPPRQEPPKEIKPTREFPYDSTMNYLEESPSNVKKYVGQEFYMFKKSKLYDKPEFDTSKKDTLIMDTFKVIDFIDKGTYHYEDSYGYMLWLALEQESTKKVFYFNYPGYEWSFPFLVLGYKKNVENKLKGKKFVSRSGSGTDINSGKNVEYSTGAIWTLEEVIISSQTNSHEFLFKNAKGEEITIDYNSIMRLDIYNKYIKNYGRSLTHSAFEGYIKVGMHEKLVVLAWGRPDRVHESSFGDTWVYEGTDTNRYVHFRNHKVSAWN